MITKTTDTSTVTFAQVAAALVGVPAAILAMYSVYGSLGGGVVQIFGFGF